MINKFVKMLVIIVIAAAIAVVVWKVFIRQTHSYSPSKAKWPIERADVMVYWNPLIEFYLGPDNKVFGYQLSVPRDHNTANTRTQKLASGIGVDFGALPGDVKKCLGSPTGIIRNTSELTTYGYWIEKDDTLLMDKGFLTLVFRDGHLEQVVSMFRDFRLNESIGFGTSRATIIQCLGKPSMEMKATKLRESI